MKFVAQGVAADFPAISTQSQSLDARGAASPVAAHGAAAILCWNFSINLLHYTREPTMHTDSDRIFQGESTFPDHEEWFYRAREGVAGPYLNKDDAALALRRFTQYCKDNRLAGGRGIPGDAEGSPGIGVVLAKASAWLMLEALSGRILAASVPGRACKGDFRKVF